MLLSKCTNPGQIFLYDGETVGLQYILRMIWNEKELPEIRLVKNDNNFDDAVSNALKQMTEDAMKGIDKEEYALPNLNTQLVTVDITKDDIKKITDYEFELIK